MSQVPSPTRQRRPLHFDALVQLARRRFDRLPDPRRCPDFSLADTLMAGLALFCLKDPSLLAFCRRALDHNLRSVFGLAAIPSDTQLRSILDEFEPRLLGPLLKDIFRNLQRGRALEDCVFLEGCSLVALEGVESFSPHKVPCDFCLPRQHKNGAVSYHHQLLGAALV